MAGTTTIPTPIPMRRRTGRDRHWRYDSPSVTMLTAINVNGVAHSNNGTKSWPARGTGRWASTASKPMFQDTHARLTAADANAPTQAASRAWGSGRKPRSRTYERDDEQDGSSCHDLWHDQIRNPGHRFPQGDEQPEHSAGSHNDRDDREPPGQSGIQPHPDPMGEGRPALSPRRAGATASLGLVEHHPQQCIAVAFPPRFRIPPQQLPVPWFVGHVTPRSAAAPPAPTQAPDWRAPSVRTAPARWFPHPGDASRPR